MSDTNAQVIGDWLAGNPGGKGKPLHTNGCDLYSYGLLIGTYIEGRPYVFNYTARTLMGIPSAGYHSQTTSQHVGLALRYANAVYNVDVWKEGQA